jgi:hypothetical protein
MEHAFRRGGETVYITYEHPQGLTQAEFEALTARGRKRHHWDVRVRDPEVYAKGAVRHPDHATLHLRDWHRVLMNTEHEAVAMRHVAFID